MIISSRSQTSNKTITTTKTVFTKLISDGMKTPNLQQTINPFEESNKFRLDQSVLSPNLFQIASSSTPERERIGSWNIEQRAVLYPVEIPTDESSLIAQYLHENRMVKQASAAVEAFWSQNKIIIESPLPIKETQTVGSKNRVGQLSLSSPFNLKSQFKNRHATSLVLNQKNIKKDQICQTMLSFPVDFDLNQIPGLKEFMIEDDEPASPKNKLNNSIRKKLFDQNSDDISKNRDDSFMSPRLRQLQKIFFINPDEKQIQKEMELVKSNDVSLNDDWEDSFNFEVKNNRSSSPSKNRNKKVLCDMDMDNHDDSMFKNERLDLSPVGHEIKNNEILSDKMDLSTFFFC